MYLIDWEYAGMNYAANDICCITCRYDWSEEQIERYFEAFVGRELTEDEHRFYWAMHCICAFYWFNWGLYKGSVGDDDGFFFLPAYRNFCKYIDRAIVSYEQIESASHISDEQERANGVGSVTAIILAGSVGARVGADRPKQFVEVLGIPVLAYTIEVFQEHPEVDNIEVVCHKQWKDYLENMVKRYNLTKVKWIADGGETFQDSVMSGVNNLKGKISDDDYVLIQYGAAPFTSQKIFDDVIRVMREHNSEVTATPCYQLIGSMDGVVSQNWVDRDKYTQIACPYGFQYGYLLDIYKRAEERNLLNTMEPHITSLMYALDDELNLAYGDQTNIKITIAEDFDMFEGYVLMKQRRQNKKVDIAGGTTMKIQNQGGYFRKLKYHSLNRRLRHADFSSTSVRIRTEVAA